MEPQKVNIFTLSKQDTNFLKGIAICAMLCHHLYGCPIFGVEPYTGIFSWLGSFGKICVAVFLFCSGYGLSARYKSLSSFTDRIIFVRNRLIKFYINYWVILLLCVLYGIFVLGRTFDIAYSGLNMPKRLLYEVFAINGGCSYLRTWWFNQLIIVCYLLFPLLFLAAKYTPFTMLIVGTLYLLFGDAHTFQIIEFNIWLFPFIIGIYWNLYEGRLEKLSEICLLYKIPFVFISVIVQISIAVIRGHLSYPDQIRIDALLVISIVLCTISIFRYYDGLMKSGAFLGKHSMNIYMIHSLFNVPILHNGEWLRSGCNVVILVMLCLIISIGVEWAKGRIGLYELQKILLSKR